MLSSEEVTVLLNTLCVRTGFCLPPADCERLRAECPPDVASFTDAVFTAEGLPPTTADLHLYRQVRGVVAATFRRHEDREQFPLDRTA